jgi:GH25 family lysozyme M1 (1,4-beta-N-acetylmuramidase)
MNKLLLFLILFPLCIQAQTILGIDVSHHQGNINWNLVANDGKVFAFVKATEGFTYNDPNFTTYMNNGTNAGVVMGAYHFARPDNNSASDEADHFVSIAGNYIGDGFLPPVLDLEDPNSNTHLDQIYTSSSLTNWVQTWMNRVESLTGIRPIIYLNSHYANFLQSSLNTYDLWIAKPGTSPTTPPNDIGNWNDWLFKQYSWTGHVNGISGDVDLDSFHGSVSDFNNLITGITTVEKKPVKIYPNPVKNILYINNLSADPIKQILLYDINGRLIYTYKNENQIDLTELNTGLYQVIIYTQSGKSMNYKITKS